MRIAIVIVCWFIASWFHVASAQDTTSSDIKHHMEKHKITVLEFHGLGVEQSLLTSLADEARVALLEDLHHNDFIILTHENTLTILNDMGLPRNALEGNDAVEIGRNIHVEYIFTGTVALVDKTYIVTLKLYDTNTANLLYAKHLESKKLSKLYKRLYKATQEGIDEHLVFTE